MKLLGLVLLFAVLVGGCASAGVTVDHSTVIGTDPQGYASGQFRDMRGGTIQNTTVMAGVGGGGTGTGGSGSGVGFLGVCIQPPPTQANPVPFARSIAMINYSRNLKRVVYDETGGIIEYEFEQKPVSSYYKKGPQSSSRPGSPSTFGFQPVE